MNWRKSEWPCGGHKWCLCFKILIFFLVSKKRFNSLKRMSSVDWSQFCVMLGVAWIIRRTSIIVNIKLNLWSQKSKRLFLINSFLVLTICRFPVCLKFGTKHFYILTHLTMIDCYILFNFCSIRTDGILFLPTSHSQRSYYKLLKIKVKMFHSKIHNLVF